MSRAAGFWMRVGTQFLPFADAASPELPLGRLVRLSLFQVSVGMAAVLLTGTLNRVMIVELGLPAALVALMVALPLMFAPARALMGHRSDHHRSALGWKRVPYLWFGTLMQFGGLAIMPFALLVMTGAGQTEGAVGVGIAGSALAFLLTGAGMHLTQTAGLALATDIAAPDKRPRVVAMLYVMLLAGMMLSALVIGAALRDFTPTRLVGVVQGAAILTILLNIVALWKQEARRRQVVEAAPAPPFREAWATLTASRRTRRLLVAVGLGAAGFAMQDVLLEPFGGEVMGLSVGATTQLTAIWAAGTLIAFALSARLLGGTRNMDPQRMAAIGALVGIAGFAAVIFSAPLAALPLLWAGVSLIGFGGGFFAVGTLVSAMDVAASTGSGLALGAWGAVHASAAGVGIIAAGLIRDGAHALASAGVLGPALSQPSTGYILVWHIEIALLFATLAALGPLVRRIGADEPGPSRPFGLAEFPA